jgi:hypothetical protein
MAEEQSAEAEVAIYIGSKIADGIVGGAATQLVANPVLNFLGIKKTDDSAEKYHQEVMGQLASLGESLNNQVRALQATLSQIKGISSQIEDYLTQEALAQVLRDYNTNATTISNLFQLFVDDVSALADQTGAEAALTDLYNNVLSSANAVRVSEAMSRIHDLVVHPSDFDKGILDYLQDVIKEEIGKYAENDDNYQYKFTRVKDVERQNYLLPRSFDYYECSKIVTNGYAVAHAEIPKIASLFRRIISTQLRGLIFLAKAWQESPHAATLRQRASEVLAEIKLMKDFYPAYRTTVDDAVADSLKKNGKFLPDELLRQCVPHREVLAMGNQTDPGGFLKHAWIMMRIEEEAPDKSLPLDHVWLVYQPWIEASQLPAGADRYCLAFKLDWGNGPVWFSGLSFQPDFQYSYLDGDVNRGNSTNFDRFIYPGLNKLDSNLPAEFAGLLNGLPTTEEDVLNLDNVLASAGRGVSMSFKCVVASDTGVWLEGNSITGALDLASRRGADDPHASTKWRLFYTLMPPDQWRNVYVKCLGFNDGDPQYLNGKDKTNQIELSRRAEPDIAGGTEWMIRPWPDNTFSFVRITDDEFGTRWMVGNTDGSVTFRTYAQDMQGLKWVAYP